MKSLIFLFALCLASLHALEIDISKNELETVINNEVIEKENEKTICDTTESSEDITTVSSKLQQCLKQIRNEKLKNKSTRVVRSIENSNEQNLNIEKLIENIKIIAKHKTDGVSQVQVNHTIEFIKPLIEKIMNVEPISKLIKTISTRVVEEMVENTIICDNGKKIKIVDAIMTNKNYMKKCEMPAPDMKNKMLEDLNETCDETEKTTIKITEICNGKTTCKLDIQKNFTGICDCTNNKYIDVSFLCVDEMPINKRSKRALHYRNSPIEIEKEREIRQRIARLEGLEYILDNLYYNENFDNALYPYQNGGLRGLGAGGLGGIGGLGGLGGLGGFAGFGGLGGLYGTGLLTIG